MGSDKKTPGRPKKYGSSAERVAAFREDSKKHRYDVYLGSEAHTILQRLREQEDCSASKILDAILTKKIELP